MDLFEFSAAGNGVLIDHPQGGIRPCAEIFRHPLGIVFLDIGWTDPYGGRHPAHIVEGEVSGSGPWKVGEIELREIVAGDQVFEEWNDWLQLRGPTGATREAAEVMLREQGYLGPD